MESLQAEKVAVFLEELTALSRKHGIKISGCGCCGSPSLTSCEPDALPYAVEERSEELRMPNKAPVVIP